MSNQQNNYNNIHINLLPHKKKRKFVISHTTRVFINVGIVAIVVLVIIYVGLQRQVDSQNKYLNDLNVRINSLSKVASVLSMRNQVANVAYSYENMVESLTKRQADLRGLIEQISMYIPSVTVLDTVNFDASKGNVTITGHTPDLMYLVWTVNTLSSNQNFSKVTVQQYNIPYQKASSGVANVTFTITFNWRQ